MIDCFENSMELCKVGIVSGEATPTVSFFSPFSVQVNFSRKECVPLNPIALRTAKIQWRIGLSECSRLKSGPHFGRASAKAANKRPQNLPPFEANTEKWWKNSKIYLKMEFS